MFYHVYLLQSLTNPSQRYVGYSTDLARRLQQHNSGMTPSTKPYRPWKIIYYEAYTNQTDAMQREKYFKTTNGRRALKLMLQHTVVDAADQ